MTESLAWLMQSRHIAAFTTWVIRSPQASSQHQSAWWLRWQLAGRADAWRLPFGAAGGMAEPQTASGQDAFLAQAQGLLLAELTMERPCQKGTCQRIVCAPSLRHPVFCRQAKCGLGEPLRR